MNDGLDRETMGITATRRACLAGAARWTLVAAVAAMGGVLGARAFQAGAACPRYPACRGCAELTQCPQAVVQEVQG